MSDYNVLQKILHYVALSGTSVLEATLDAELAFCKSRMLNQGRQKHVFISGLARAGTTILMRSLYESQQFSSLTYADMPFVLAPNLWLKLSGKWRKNMEAKERAHGDGILVDYNSPEALDEVFWRTFVGKQYIGRDAIVPHSCDDETVEKFRKYIAVILLRYAVNRYLSKNNNNILRLACILQAFPNAIILIPFREPLQHSNSLLNQHKLFKRKQSEDSFVRHYMSWLGHYEFGLSHKRFKTSGSRCVNGDTSSIDYWLEQWCNVYNYLLKETEKFSDNIIFVSYELFCLDTDVVWQSLREALDIGDAKKPEMNIKRREVPTPSDTDQLERAQHIYELLTAISRDRLIQ